MIVYHYTSEQGIRGIQRSGMIRASSNTTLDAIIGVGVYVTTMGPDNSSMDIALNNWDTSRSQAKKIVEQGRLAYAIQLDIPRGELTSYRGSRDVWVKAGNIYLDEYSNKIIERGRDDSDGIIPWARRTQIAGTQPSHNSASGFALSSCGLGSGMVYGRRDAQVVTLRNGSDALTVGVEETKKVAILGRRAAHKQLPWSRRAGGQISKRRSELRPFQGSRNLLMDKKEKYLHYTKQTVFKPSKGGLIRRKALMYGKRHTQILAVRDGCDELTVGVENTKTVAVTGKSVGTGGSLMRTRLPALMAGVVNQWGSA